MAERSELRSSGLDGFGRRSYRSIVCEVTRGVQADAAWVDAIGVAMSRESELSNQRRLALVTTGRTKTIVSTCAVLALLAWLVRPVVRALAGGSVSLHHGAATGLLGPLFVVSVGLIGGLVVICLNRVLLHGVAWILAGAAANLGELVATGSVADYLRVGSHRLSPGDVYLSVGIGLLALGAIKVIRDGRAR